MYNNGLRKMVPMDEFSDNRSHRYPKNTSQRSRSSGAKLNFNRSGLPEHHRYVQPDWNRSREYCVYEPDVVERHLSKGYHKFDRRRSSGLKKRSKPNYMGQDKIKSDRDFPTQNFIYTSEQTRRDRSIEDFRSFEAKDKSKLKEKHFSNQLELFPKIKFSLQNSKKYKDN
ncbi:unnamed protein product [Brachionus calyciflorus]|uniref:Uncharacterized protein n=1 Tax=Brachionus calyciflorus TaxID=104777 RepID=A0A814HA91_9BILA|nr:unnamed protein product [Brachionus calyciflorus]